MLGIWLAASLAGHAFLGAEVIEAQRALVRDVYIPAADNWPAEEGEVLLGFIGLRAIAFYRRFGFEVDAATATPHAVPHWIMRRAGIVEERD